ncbi:aspartate/glutamate racemase family protein [Micromonospora sp. NPDC002389]|uniref:aspartate/glutamate racemase family protein n=1 Tax=Micromonospora sp. NPDC002389 TaxID=3154272 RepID=UPI00332FEE80
MSEPRRLAVINSDAKRAPVLPDPPGLVTDLVDPRLRRFARTKYDHLLTELGTVDAAEAAIAAGCDAVYIDTFADYGMAQLRAAAPVPVVGAGEAVLAWAADSGRRFSIVTVWPVSMDYIYADRLAACPGGELAVGVHYLSDESELDRVGTDAGVKARMGRGEDDVVAAITRACLDAAQRDGTDLILFGCTCMTPVSAEVARRAGIEIVDPSVIGLRAGHAAALGPRPEPPVAAQRLGAVTQLVDAYLGVADGSAGASCGVDADGCEVCAVTAGPSS